MYTLDFETIKLVMQEHQKTGLLYADVPPGAVGLNEPCRIEIKLEAGTIVSCSIVGRSGQRLPQKESIKRISRLGAIVWTFVPQTVAAPLPSPPSPPVASGQFFFPRRTAQLTQMQMQTWPRIHRQVFALADGTRNIIKMAEILSVTPDVVERILRDLQAIGVIRIEP